MNGYLIVSEAITSESKLVKGAEWVEAKAKAKANWDAAGKKNSNLAKKWAEVAKNPKLHGATKAAEFGAKVATGAKKLWHAAKGKAFGNIQKLFKK